MPIHPWPIPNCFVAVSPRWPPGYPIQGESMTESPVDVVISGAGPNGLMVACELALAGVRPVVLERLPAPSDEPKANGMVGQVIRLLDMRGLYQRFSGSDDPPKPRTNGCSADCRCRCSAFATIQCTC